jgi:hypothetical protein
MVSAQLLVTFIEIFFAVRGETIPGSIAEGDLWRMSCEAATAVVRRARVKRDSLLRKEVDFRV